VEFTGPGLELEGWVSRPATARDRRDVQYLFVNGRAVHDRTLLHAVAEGFGNTMPHGRRPAAFLFLTVASVDVDVNVHPQKSEVRFARPWEVHDPIREAIRRALGGTTVVPGYGELRAPAPRSTGNAALPPVQERLGLEPRPAPETAVAEPAAVPAVAAAGRFQALAQFAESYILGADADGIVVVDQHAAHERVLFERFLAQVEAGQVEIQRLVVPQVVELTPAEAATLEDEAGELRRLGILVDAFGARAARVEGVPAVAAALDPGELLRQVLGDAARLRAAATGIAGLRRSLVTTAACRAAVKIHHHLHRDAMQALLDDLARTANPTTCPHGRPILFRLTRRDIERAFQRT
jgi:DNA mismatch repair protein MutL